ncbi:hypothetical protein ACFX2J_024807 [Malus domestica]
MTSCDVIVKTSYNAAMTTRFDVVVMTSCGTIASYHYCMSRLYARTASGTTLPLMHIVLMVSPPLGLYAPHCSCHLLVHARHQCINALEDLLMIQLLNFKDLVLE